MRVPKVLLVLDMLNGFCLHSKNLYVGPQIRKVISFVRRKVQAYRQKKLPVIFVADNHDPQDLEFRMFPRHCVRGTSETQLIEELRPLAPTDVMVKKKSAIAAFMARGGFKNRLDVVHIFCTIVLYIGGNA